MSFLTPVHPPNPWPVHEALAPSEFHVHALASAFDPLQSPLFSERHINPSHACVLPNVSLNCSRAVASRGSAMLKFMAAHASHASSRLIIADERHQLYCPFGEETC